MLSQDLLKRRIAEGVLAFPATPFEPGGAVDLDIYAAQLGELASYRPAAMVVAGGAGELFALSVAEQGAIVQRSAEVVSDIPIIAGVGFGVAIACEMARASEHAGASALLLFPPYLVGSEQAGLARYVEAVCRSTAIGVIVYSRGNGVLSPDTSLRLADACPNLVAVKDGTGDFEAMTVLKHRVGDRLTLINGVPTAEMIARQCFSLGIRSYTSAVFTFLPALAMRYFKALREGDEVTVDRLLRQFYIPLSEIRSRRQGYAVSIVKAGLRIVGRPAGPVRPPLVELSPADERDLAALIERAPDVLAESASPAGKAPAARVAG
jgi:5-dehydro-4-deoxyglucarate dehydratase